jgi:hypothetical protein
MGSAARRCDAYGGEYLRAGLRLCARGVRRKAKYLVKLGQKDYRQKATAADPICPVLVVSFLYALRRAGQVD